MQHNTGNGMVLTSKETLRKNRAWDSESDLHIHLQNMNRILTNQNDNFNYNNTLLQKFLVNHPNDDSELSQFTSGSSSIVQSQLLHLQDQISDHTAQENLMLSDPQYKYFLNHLRLHGNSYVFEIAEDGVFVKYEHESSSSSSLFLNAHANYKGKLRVRKSKGEKLSAAKSPNVKRNRVASNSRKYSSSTSRGRKLKGAKFSEVKNPRVNRRDVASNAHNRKKGKQTDTTSCIEIMKVKEEIEDYDDDATDIRTRPMESTDLVELFGYDNEANARKLEFREKLMNELRRAYCEEEHKRLLSDFTVQKPVQSCKDLRTAMKIYDKDYLGKSYRDHNLDLANEMDSAGDDRPKVLNLLRGFFFWLGNLTHEGAFMPWRVSSCLDVPPQQ